MTINTSAGRPKLKSQIKADGKQVISTLVTLQYDFQFITVIFTVWVFFSPLTGWSNNPYCQRKEQLSHLFWEGICNKPKSWVWLLSFQQPLAENCLSRLWMLCCIATLKYPGYKYCKNRGLDWYRQVCIPPQSCHQGYHTRL